MIIIYKGRVFDNQADVAAWAGVSDDEVDLIVTMCLRGGVSAHWRVLTGKGALDRGAIREGIVGTLRGDRQDLEIKMQTASNDIKFAKQRIVSAKAALVDLEARVREHDELTRMCLETWVGVEK